MNRRQLFLGAAAAAVAPLVPNVTKASGCPKFPHQMMQDFETFALMWGPELRRAYCEGLEDMCAYGRSALRARIEGDRVVWERVDPWL